jgi:tight adherence protein B
MLVYTLLPVLVLLTGAAIIASAFVLTPSARAEIERRIRRIASRQSGKSAGASETDGENEDAAFNERVRRVFAFGAKYRWGMHVGGAALLLVSIVCGTAVWQFSMRVVGLPGWMSISAGALAAFLAPHALLVREQRRAEARFRDLFPDAIDTVVRMLRAGLPMTSAVRIVGTEAPAPINSVFTMISDQVKIGIPVEQALDSSSKRIGLSDFRFFAVAVLLQYSAGGNIAATLDMLSGIMRKRRAVRQKAQSATAEIRLTGYVLGALPLLTIGGLMVVQPGYLKPLFIDPRGHFILAMAAGGLLMSFLSMRQMMRSVTTSQE